jgi:hydroxypyruvate isomerase
MEGEDEAFSEEGCTGMKSAICIEMLYPGLSHEEKIRRIARHGFRNVEFWGYKDKDLVAIQQAASESSVSIVNFSGNRAGDLVDASTHETVLREIRESVQVAQRLGTHSLMVLSNELGDGGKVLHACTQLGGDKKHDNLVAGLKRLMEDVPDDISIMLEPLNTALDHPGNYLTGMKEAEQIVGEAGNPRLKILCDFYHMALMGEYPPETARRYTHFIGYVHIADYPGRHEPGTGQGPWKETLKELRDQGYEGYIGFEFAPSGDSDIALDAVSRLWRQALGPDSMG